MLEEAEILRMPVILTLGRCDNPRHDPDSGHLAKAARV